jgi:shikimate dehydrogenase
VTTFLFVGVTTGQSSSRRTFPLWMEILGHPEVKIEGVDLPLGAPASAYRAVVERIQPAPDVVGGLVTSHKIDLLDASRDLFDELDPYALICGEVSAIAKRDGRLIGVSTDPVAGGRALHEILGKGYFGRTGGEVLCLGAGGAGTALALALMDRPDPVDRPQRFTAVDVNRSRLDRLRAILEHSESDIEFQFVHNTTPVQTDVLLSTLPSSSLVINATGLGKDRPGSPLTDAAIFPVGAIAWELNYRGDLDFLHQAQRQRDERRLRVEDGWRYFLYGWLGVIAVVLDISIDDEAFQRCAAVAADVR